jgi:SAM-dependent methyltransferase
MGLEINLLKNYPKSQRNINARATTNKNALREIARRFDKDFFDGPRSTGYGGFAYDPRFWQPVIPTLGEHFNISSSCSVLDVGCAKGFFLYDLTLAYPGIQVSGLDISTYAIENALPEVIKFLKIGDAVELPYRESSFDLVISINTIHNLELKGVVQALKEIERVSRGNSFVTVDAYRTEEEKEQIDIWNLTAKTILHVDQWREVFEEAGYTGDYYWFIP